MAWKRVEGGEDCMQRVEVNAAFEKKYLRTLAYSTMSSKKSREQRWEIKRLLQNVQHHEE